MTGKFRKRARAASHHAIAGGKAAHAGTDRDDLARAFHSGGLRRAGLQQPVAHDELAAIQARGTHLHEELSGSRRWRFDVATLERCAPSTPCMKYDRIAGSVILRRWILPLHLPVRALLKAQKIAALGTIHEGEPYVSMVPFALLPRGPDFVIHVSTLAAHTGDMLASSKASLLVIAPEEEGVPPQARARITIQGEALQVPHAAALYPEAREAYLRRFPESAQTFELGDFSLFAIRARLCRFVGGFAQARSLTADGLATILAG
jgi:hypothetical protein